MKNYKKTLVLLVVILFMISMIPAALADEGKKINVNTATVEELVNLKGLAQSMLKG